jgi:hypothetical protein
MYGNDGKLIYMVEFTRHNCAGNCKKFRLPDINNLQKEFRVLREDQVRFEC